MDPNELKEAFEQPFPELDLKVLKERYEKALDRTGGDIELAMALVNEVLEHPVSNDELLAILGDV